ncbi:MAG: acryloyl-coenzyme A reductase [Myxococcota bacterium]|jgi:acryloyl-coenzyme A reductase
MIEKIVMTEAGWDADLEVVTGDGSVPTPGPGQVTVALEASGVCHRDLIDRAGRIPFLQTPVVPGHEGVGRVVAVGAGSKWSVGDRVATLHRDNCGSCTTCQAGETSLCQSGAWVLGLIANGTYARHLVVPCNALYRTSETMEAGMAASLHCTFGTAWRGLVAAGRLVAGERVLITGANGGVGAAAVQIAARFAREVVAVVRREGHEEYLRGLGATQVVVSADNRFHYGVTPVDLALDCVGVPTFNAALRSLRVGGRVVVVGNVTDERSPVNLGHLITMGKSVIGPGGASPRDMAEVLAEHGREAFVSVVTGEFPLGEADAVQRRLLAGGLRGRMVLRV